MTLRTRLTLFFVGIVVVPLVAAGFSLRGLVAREIDTRTNTRLEVGAGTVTALWSERLDRAELEVASAANDVAERLARTRGRELDLEPLRARSGLDFLVLEGPEGGLLSAAVGPVDVSGAPPAPEDLASPDGPPAQRAHAEVIDGDRLLSVTGGWVADARTARLVRSATGLEVAVLHRGAVVASTDAPPPVLPSVPGQTSEVTGGLHVLLVPVGEGTGELLLMARSEGGLGLGPVLAVVAGGLLLAGLLGYGLARLVTLPLHRLAEGARAVAAGDLDTRIEVGDRGDVARVAEVFNAMTDSLRARMSELRESRDGLRRTLGRFGATLRSTLELEGMLGGIVDTAVVTTGADAGAVFLLRPGGRELVLEAARGYEPPEGAVVAMGQGIAGEAALGEPVLVPAREATLPTSPAEHPAATAVAVPLIRGDRVIGVIALYGRSAPGDFDEADADGLAAFADQASVAIENVLLHQETQRLSITDELTGAWNRRYLDLTLGKEIDRAQRFERPLSLLMVDIDHFKDVNDRYGHQEGDALLIEVTHRISSSIRGQIDTVARYGGEEFAIVLPETPREGALVVAEKIRDRIAIREFRCGGGPERVTVSVGVASHPDDGTTAAQMLRAADDALYRAKQSGRNRVEAAGAA